MSGSIEVRITGDRKMMRALRKLSDAAGDTEVKDALRHAVKPIIADAKGRAPSAVIARGIRLIQIKKDGDGLAAEVGLPGGPQPWFHGLFVELGTGPRYQKKTGRFTGSMPASPFLRPAFGAKAKAARDEYFQRLKSRMEKTRG